MNSMPLLLIVQQRELLLDHRWLLIECSVPNIQCRSVYSSSEDENKLFRSIHFTNVQVINCLEQCVETEFLPTMPRCRL